MNLAPDIQEALLFLPEVGEGKDVVTERKMRTVVANCGWGKQRAVWRTTVFTARIPKNVRP